jgi:hypothetical protein
MSVLTFIQAGNSVRLAKVFTPTTKKGYPNVSKVTSHVYHVTNDAVGLEQMHKLMVSHAAQGHALLRGQLKKELKNQSRAGLTNKTLVTDWITIDIDNLDLVKAKEFGFTPNYPLNGSISRANILVAAEYLVKLLPMDFHNVSYIATASASTGMKPNKLSMHLDFMLTNPVHPQTLKNWLTKLNFDVPVFNGQLNLSSNGLALIYPCDRTVADNSKLIYIAPPVLQDVEQRLDDKDRILIVEKQDTTVELMQLFEGCTIEQVDLLISKAIKQLRKDGGLPAKTRKMQSINNGSKVVEIISNPDRALMHLAYFNEKYCYANLQDKSGIMGDSNAYWWPKDNPQIVYNFKDEPPFRMKDVDMDFFKAICAQFKEDISSLNIPVPYVFRDVASDEHYSLTYDTTNDRIMRLGGTKKQNLKDFMANHGEEVPEPIPDWDRSFNPQTTVQLDIENRFVNTYQPTKYLLHKELSEEDEHPLEYGRAYLLKKACPTLYAIMYHMVGSSGPEFEHFFNWFAYGFQTKQKLTTAWVFTGIEGTGKGLFFHQIIHPLYGLHAAYKTLDNVEDKFNDFAENALFMVVDEFKITDSVSSTKMMNKLKHMVTETFGTIRGMHQAQRQVRLYANMCFNSNEIEVLRISQSDRRFNIGKRQEVPILATYPKIMEDIKKHRDKELINLVEFINAYEADPIQAYQPLDNEAKRLMRDASMTWIDHFITATITGNLDYFVEKILCVDASLAEDISTQMNAERIVKNWVANAGQEEPVSTQDLHTLCNAIESRAFTKEKFAKMLGKRGVDMGRIRYPDGTRKRGVIKCFQLIEYGQEELIEHHFSSTDKEVLCQKSLH